MTTMDSNRVISVMRKPVLFVLCGFLWLEKQIWAICKEVNYFTNVLRFACLQSCVPKDIYKGFAWINGGRPEGQHSAGAVQSCEREPWALPEWVGGCECSEQLPHAGMLEPNTSRCLVPVSNQILCSSDCLRGGNQETLASFWVRIPPTLCFLCLRWGLPFLPQLWSLCFAE